MNSTLKTTGLATLLAAGAMLLPAGASAGSINAAATKYCNIERNDDRQDFIREFGSLGKAGMQRCVSSEIRKAKRECRADLRNDRRDYIRQFGGTDRRAFNRCIRYELLN